MTYTPTPIGKDDSRHLTTLLKQNFDDIAAALGTGGPGTFPLFSLTGRLQSTTTATDHPPEEPPSTALALVLPVGFTWLQDGALFTVTEDDGDTLLTGVPANFAGYLSLEVAEEDGTSTWGLSSSATRGALGSGTLCYVETDSDGVALLDASPLRADVIPPLPLLLRRLQVLEAGGSGGGGSGGGAAYASLLPWSADDPRPTTVVIEEKLGALRAEMLAAIATGGRRPRQTNIDQVVRELALARQATISLAPPAGLRSQSANVLDTVAGLWGSGENSSPDFIDTELVLNPDGTLEA